MRLGYLLCAPRYTVPQDDEEKAPEGDEVVVVAVGRVVQTWLSWLDVTRFFSLTIESFLGNNNTSFKIESRFNFAREMAIRVFTKGVPIFESG